MTKKQTPRSTKKQSGIVHPGMMGDGTEEQSLNECRNPATPIKKDEVDAGFGRGTENMPVSMSSSRASLRPRPPGKSQQPGVAVAFGHSCPHHVSSGCCRN